jgi:HPt (histidine-containing phosphotransfer) domain-containing protein
LTTKVGAPGSGPSEPSKEIIALYREHMPSYLVDMQQALDDGDRERVYFHCHKMSSAIKIMGFDNIASLLETIQREKPEGDELDAQCQLVQKLVNHTLLLLDK